MEGFRNGLTGRGLDACRGRQRKLANVLSSSDIATLMWGFAEEKSKYKNGANGHNNTEFQSQLRSINAGEDFVLLV